MILAPPRAGLFFFPPQSRISYRQAFDALQRKFSEKTNIPLQPCNLGILDPAEKQGGVLSICLCYQRPAPTVAKAGKAREVCIPRNGRNFADSIVKLRAKQPRLSRTKQDRWRSVCFAAAILFHAAKRKITPAIIIISQIIEFENRHMHQKTRRFFVHITQSRNQNSSS